jgi:SpoVK/Ycf46/Vps4 family AAA+-type ATPase
MVGIDGAMDTMFLGKKKACIALLAGTLLQSIEALKNFNYTSSAQSRAAGAALLCGFSCCVGMGAMGCLWLASNRHKRRIDQLARAALMQQNQTLAQQVEALRGDNARATEHAKKLTDLVERAKKKLTDLVKQDKERESKLKAAKEESQEQPKKKHDEDAAITFSFKDYCGEIPKPVSRMLKASREQPIQAICSRYNVQHGRNMLFCGPPGTGKTLLALCMAGEWNIPYLLVAPTEVLSAFVNGTVELVKKVFEQASSLAEQAPKKMALVVFDEIDAIGSARGNNNDSGGIKDANNTLIALISEIDGLRSKRSHTKIIVIGTTNRPESLDPALTRPGRLGVRIDFSLTKSAEEVAKSLSYFLKVHNLEIEYNKRHLFGSLFSK